MSCAQNSTTREVAANDAMRAADAADDARTAYEAAYADARNAWDAYKATTRKATR